MTKGRKKMRRRVFLLLILTTILVFLAIGGIYALTIYIPQMKQAQIESALAEGDYEAVESAAAELTEEEQIAILQQSNYLQAQQAEAAGNYAEASALYAEASGYEDAADRRRACDYKQAEVLESQGSWDEAYDLYHSLGSFSDSADRAQQVRYEQALALVEAGEGSAAIEILDTLTNMPEAQELLLSVAEDLTGFEGDRALAAVHGMSEEDLAMLSHLDELRAQLPDGIIDVGFYHTVGLGADGRVYACGDNSYGQCDTSSWSGAVQVAAGAYHTAALLSDGTVAAVGRNDEGQCDTSEWSGIVQVAANDYSTFGLRSDGTIVCTGMMDTTVIDSWSGMASISAGSYGIAAQRSDGTLWFYPEPAGSEELTSGVSYALNTGYAAAVQSDGSVKTTAGFDLSSWSRILKISCSSTAILALEPGGFVDAYYFRAEDALDFSSVSNAVAIAAGATHCAVVLSDGSVQVFGGTGKGETETQGWVLAVDAD